MKVLLALHRIGPYHHARLQAAAQQLEVLVLETRPQSEEYPWSFNVQGSYEVHQIQGQPHPDADPPTGALDLQLEELLARLQPQVVVSVGWADRTYQRLLLAAHRQRIPSVIVSDSRACDEHRSRFKETIKRQVLKGYSSALVAGCESRVYLQKLGFLPGAIAQPWDVVDNDVFSKSAIHQSHEASCIRPHFLCVSRFIAKKNHVGLLSAYGAYQIQGGLWDLRLIGAGPLQTTIEDAISQLPDPTRVRLDTFMQLEALSACYGQASAFVLASTTDQWGLVVNEAMAAGLPCLVSSACGCAIDLMEHGRTGWVFHPGNPKALAELFHLVETQRPRDRAAMVVAARSKLEAFSPQAFATGLGQALEWALAKPRFSRRASFAARLLSLFP